MLEVSTRHSVLGWTIASLGDVVAVINEYWDRDTTVAERLVAGEHIDEGDLRIRRWAMTDDDLIPPTFNRWFQSGDVLLHSRNIKKVARPDFRGITGEKLFILRSKDDAVLLQDLVPFLVQSDQFRSYAEARWAGSTNKFLNKTPLQEFEFALPPIEEQRKLVRVLEAAEEAAEAVFQARLSADQVRRSLASKLILGTSLGHSLEDVDAALLKPGWTIQPASEVCSDQITKGATPTRELGETDTGIPFLKVYNLTFDGSLDFSVRPSFISANGHSELRRSVVRPGDVLMNIVGPPLGKVSRVPKGFPEANINQAIARYRLADEGTSEWLSEYLLTPLAQSWLYARSKKTSGQRNLTLTVCRDLPIVIPPPRSLQSVIGVLRGVRAGVVDLDARRAAIRTFSRRLMAAHLGAIVDV